jgi:hypothetical protein
MITDKEIHEAASSIVKNEVYYCVSSLISDLVKIASNCDLHGLHVDLDYDELLNLSISENWSEPASWFIMHDADMDELEAIADNNGYWDEVLLGCGVPETAAQKSDMICLDCHTHLQIPEGDETLSDKRRAELDNFTNEFMKEPKEYMARLDLDEEFYRPMHGCDCCGSTLAGSYFAYTNMEDYSDDLNDRIASMEDPEAAKRAIRKAVDDLVTDDDSYRKICEDNGIDPEYREVYEHWIVSNWLAARLEEKGEITGEVSGLTIWGRCTTGQSISMDWVIEQIAKETC